MDRKTDRKSNLLYLTKNLNFVCSANKRFPCTNIIFYHKTVYVYVFRIRKCCFLSVSLYSHTILVSSILLPKNITTYSYVLEVLSQQKPNSSQNHVAMTSPSHDSLTTYRLYFYTPQNASALQI